MRVLLFTESAELGGAEKVVLFLALSLGQRGHYTKVVTLRKGWLTNELARAQLVHEHLPSENRLDFTLPFRLARLARSFEADVIHSHLLDSNFYASMAARLAGISHVATDHGDVHLPSKKHLQSLKTRVIGLMGSNVTAVSAFTSKRLVELGLPSDRVSTIYNPFIQGSPTRSQDRWRVRSELGLASAEHHWVWASVAVLSSVKDHATLLRGFRRSLEIAGEDQTLLVIGDGHERDSLMKLADSLAVSPHMRFLGFRDDVSALLAGSDGFILTSLSESMPMSLIEAAAAGMLAISTSVGGVPEIVRHRETGYLFEPGDDRSLGELMALALMDRAQSRRCATRLNEDVNRRFSADVILQQYERLYAKE